MFKRLFTRRRHIPHRATAVGDPRPPAPLPRMRWY